MSVAQLMMLLMLQVIANAQDDNIYRISNGRSSTIASHIRGHRLTVKPGESMVLADITGPGKITYIYFTDAKVKGGGPPHADFAPGIVLKIFWDDSEEPSVNVPLADFLGAIGGRVTNFESAAFQSNHYCLSCTLPMPFSKRARLVLTNDGDTDYVSTFASGIDYEMDEVYRTEPSRFHASWQRSNPVEKGKHLLLDVKGKGHYIGNFLQVSTKFSRWWGEGDIIFTVDGQRYRHTYGTEDEYGSCWGMGRIYNYLCSGYIEKKDIKNEGEKMVHTNRMYRFYLPNPVRFQTSLKVEMQNEIAPTPKGMLPGSDDYTSVVYWYQEGAQGVDLASYEDRTAPTLANDYNDWDKYIESIQVFIDEYNLDHADQEYNWSKGGSYGGWEITR